MRKLILISALLLASASAQAGEILLAADAAPTAYSTNHAEPLPPVAKNDDKSDQDDSAKPQVDERAAQLRAAKMRMEARRMQEAKARRMASRYGSSW